MKLTERLAASLAVVVVAASAGLAPRAAAGGENVRAYPPARSLGNQPRWGLAEIFDRIDKVPYEKIRTEGVFTQTQRTIFRDCAFGGEIWRLTGPGVDSNHYYSQVPPWNADGSLIGFDAGYPEQQSKAYIADADGTNLREFPFRKIKGLPPGVRFGYKAPCWDLDEPAIMYGMAKITQNEAKALTTQPAEKRDLMTGLYAADVLTGAVRVVAEVPKGYMDSQPFRHAGKQWLIIVALPTLGREHAFATLTTDGKEIHYIPRSLFPSGRRDSVILTHTPGYPLALGGYIMSPTGEKADVSVPRLKADPAKATGVIERSVLKLGGYGPRDRITGGHACHSYDGLSAIGVGGQLTRIDFAPDRGYYQRSFVLSTGGSGHVSWLNRDKRWVYPTLYANTSPTDPCAGMVIKLATDGSEVVHRVCFHNSDPKVYAAQIRGAVSRDGTKVAFISNALGHKVDETSLYIAVVKHPDPPADLSAEAGEGGVRLTWKKPFNSVEIKGTYIYRSGKSGVGYEQITPEPVAGTEFIDKTAPATGPVYYVATSMEHSSLESSRYSDEAAVRVAGQPVRLFFEAEDGACQLPCRTERDVTAVGDECVWFPGKESTLTLSAGVPAAGDYAVWARVKGPAGAEVLAVFAGRKPVPARISDDSPWTWVKFPAGRLVAEKTALVFTGRGGAKIDRFCLSSDAAFTPAGRGSGDETPPGAVTGLAAGEAAAHWVRLTWKAPADADVRHFNVYCSKTAGFSPSQATLVWSPSKAETSLWDYGLRAGTEYYYRMTAVDRAGNESAPSEEVAVRTAAAAE